MNAEIIAVGTELLMGQIVNSDAQFLSQQLSKLGISVFHHTVVGDNPGRLTEAVETAFGRSDLVIFSGGLGPTKDDLTKETVAAYFGLELQEDAAAMENIVEYHNRLGRKMAENNKKQALIPAGGEALSNKNGTAPGVWLAQGGKIAVLLPGPPSELKPMFTEEVAPRLCALSDSVIESKVLRIFGIGESRLETEILDLVAGENPTVALYAKEGEVTLRIAAKAETKEAADAMIAPVEKEIRTRFGDMVYGEGDDNSLCAVVGQLLMEQNITLATAESCTGGMLAAELTALSGISSVFLQGIVSYTNEAKMQHLGVKAETLAQYGAVSRQTAIEMAEGMRRTAKSDLAVSVTGIAGPTGGTPEKPVGLVYVAVAAEGKTRCRQLHLAGNRQRIRKSTVLNALDMVRRAVLGLEE